MTQSEIYFQKGILLAKEGRNNEAIEQLSQIIKIDKSNSRVFLNRGILYKRIGDMNKANLDFISAAELGNEKAQKYLETFKRSNGLEDSTPLVKAQSHEQKNELQEKVSDLYAYALLFAMFFSMLIGQLYLTKEISNGVFVIFINLIWVSIITLLVIDLKQIKKSFQQNGIAGFVISFILFFPVYFFKRQKLLKNSYAPYYISFVLAIPQLIFLGTLIAGIYIKLTH